MQISWTAFLQFDRRHLEIPLVQNIQGATLNTMNIRFVLRKKRRLADFGPWDLRAYVIIFYRLNYPEKNRALKGALYQISAVLIDLKHEFNCGGI